MKDKKFLKAYTHYDISLKQTTSREYLIKFFLNKAIVCLNLNLIKDTDKTSRRFSGGIQVT